MPASSRPRPWSRAPASRGRSGSASWVALTGIAALAVVAGKYLVGRIPLRLIHLVAGGVFAAFAVVAIVAAIRG